MSGAATKSTALWVVRTLRKAGFKALFAGGCVRDMLLGIRSTDYDVATDATPDQVRRLFRHVLLVGAKFGVAMVIVNRRRVEVTTFRSEESYSDGRRPDHVRFTTPQQDAMRRDFTINGMFYDPIARQVIDYVGGREDLKAGIVRTINEPQLRFGEDYLRMIRAVRFAVRFGFKIDPATAQAVRDNAHKITAISGERIVDELTKMLARPTAAAAAQKLAELGLARHIMPELFASPSQWPAAIARVEGVARYKDATLAVGAMLAELDVRQIVAVIRRWGGSNELRNAALFLARHLNGFARAASVIRPASVVKQQATSGISTGSRGFFDKDKSLTLAQFKRLLANPNFPRLQKLWRVQEKLQTGRNDSSHRIARLVRSIPREQIAPAPFVTGNDLMRMGLTEGARLGQILKALYDAQLNEQVKSRAEATRLAQELIAGKR